MADSIQDEEKRGAKEFSAGSLIIREADENDVISTIYEGSSTADVSMRKVNASAISLASLMNGNFIQALVTVFLPTGYPHSVKSDYVDYQIYDSIQAFSSSIAMLFANRSVLSAVGVGDDTATSTSALFMKIIQETVGRMGTIIFAYKLGSILEPECKKYRYVADLVNDTAIVFDCMSPMFPGSKNMKILMLCVSGVLRSICGVIAGGSRAALTQHFTDPERGSIADVNAKDQSQETVISLLGMLAGSVVVGVVKGEGFTMWLVLFLLLSVHLWTNYQAVRHVVIITLNRQRTNILFSDILTSLPELENAVVNESDHIRSISHLVLTPRKVSARERILEVDGALRLGGRGDEYPIAGYATFGTFAELLSNARQIRPSAQLADLLNACDSRASGYVLSYSAYSKPRICISLLHGGFEKADLKAWVHALLVARYLNSGGPSHDPLKVISDTRLVLSRLFDEIKVLESLELAGWDLERVYMQSHPSPKILLDEREGL